MIYVIHGNKITVIVIVIVIYMYKNIYMATCRLYLNGAKYNSLYCIHESEIIALASKKLIQPNSYPRKKRLYQKKNQINRNATVTSMLLKDICVK